MRRKGARMLKTRIGMLMVALSIALTGSALAAGSQRIPQHGKVKGDARASVRLVVIREGGAPKSVKSVKFNDLRMSCSRGPARVDLDLSGTARVRPDRTFAIAYGENKQVRLKGRVRSDSKRVVAFLRGTSIRTTGAGRCQVPDRKLVTHA